MRNVKHLQVDDIRACVYYLKDPLWGDKGCVEVHFFCDKQPSIVAARKLLKYLDEEGFVTTQWVKLISLPQLKGGELDGEFVGF